MREKDFAMLNRTLLVAMLIGFANGPSVVRAADPVPSAEQARLLSNVRQVTFEGRRSGEGYFSADGSKMIFQSERDPKNPFYQIFVLDLNTGNTKRVSTGTGKTTCPWLHPDGKLALFASTHDDPDSLAKQQIEIDRRASGKTKRYEWDYDENYEIYSTKLGSGKYENLTRTRGYDAEGSFSPDGKWIAFASNRHAYTDTLSEENRHLLEIDAKVFLEIYIMRADGSEVKRLTDVMGYDGGPFFSPDGKRICWRRFTPDGNTAEIWTMNIDGTDPRQITRLGNMSWAPFYHPSGEYLIFTTDINGRSNFELYIVDVDGKKDPVRASNLPAFDGLPVFFPDGKRLAWTSNRTPNKKGQLFFADFNDAKARELLSLAADRKVTATDSSKKSARKAETSRAVTAQDAAFHRERISALVEEHNNADAGAGYALDTLKSFGFVYQEVVEDEKGNIAFGLSLRPAEPTGRGPLHVCLTLDKPTSQKERKEFASQLACLIEIGEHLTFEAKNNAGGLARELMLLVVFKTDRSDDGTWFAQASEGFGEGYAAAIEIRGLTHRSGKYVIDGVGTSPRWSRLLERLNVSIGLPLEINNVPRPNSLSFLLHEQSVPAISISRMPAEDGSVVEKNDAEKSDMRATKLVARMLERLAVEPEAPKFTRITKRKGAVKGRPYLGTEPDYAGKTKGVVLKGVVENGPAHSGGLRAGDMIVQIGETPIPDINAYAAALDNMTAGENILITVVRGDERIPIRVIVGERKP